MLWNGLKWHNRGLCVWHKDYYTTSFVFIPAYLWTKIKCLLINCEPGHTSMNYAEPKKPLEVCIIVYSICFASNWGRDYNLSFSLKLVPANCCFFQKSKQHGDKETESSQNIGFAKTTLAEQKVASSFVVQDAVRNVTIKPETTKRQDDVTGRLPRYTRYTSPRMMKTQARVQESTMSKQKNVPPEVYSLY